ncbi:lytic murein transglycosylase B [Denitratisoma oestradiolicum]|uniref:Lytic murein transglycosylase B n=1 Tax=Denitratisoma oestradiolicum TaxID=311182 RepID=A0A6S6XUK2_9PROT|nr:lytic murein transglycosylase B [Denitratisoma oestradiolicum]TWO81292.1 lytic murein transglycosylase B [Denitratisoma oestradiolicum]CAB1368475.1 Lytic murein transglycosylase B [Denitratisoma oestradiolicum]
MKFLPHILFFLAANLLPCSALASDYARREDVRDFIADISRRHDFDATELLILFHKVRPLPAVLKAIQPSRDPGIRSWQAYRGRFVEPRRIAAGIKFWGQHQDALLRAETLYGVPPEIIVAIIGVETIYGRHMGRFETFSALSNLAFDYPPRAELFRRELEALLLLAREEGHSPLAYHGSYAGALGMPQFLPSSQRRFAVDFDRDGAVDLRGSSADAIGSVGRFLSEHGWQRGGPILTPAAVRSERATELLAEGITPRRLPREMSDYGVEVEGAPEAPAALIDYVTPQAETEYRLGYQNFFVITRYNRSSFYATVVADLAAALRQVMSSEQRVAANTVPR